MVAFSRTDAMIQVLLFPKEVSILRRGEKAPILSGIVWSITLGDVSLSRGIHAVGQRNRRREVCLDRDNQQGIQRSCSADGANTLARVTVGLPMNRASP